MKKAIQTVLLVLVLCIPFNAGAQGHVRRAMREAKEKKEAMDRAQAMREKAQLAPEGEIYMAVKVENGDTTFFDRISPTYVLARGKGRTERQWRNYYKLVWRFAKVYPYALASGGLKRQVDSTLSAEHFNGFRKERYMNAIQKQLFHDFEGALHEMSIQQGALLLKLIDRETGLPPYTIIKDYKSGAAAGFWQAIAKLFDNDLKSQYDPEGADREIEELVQIWQAGEFPALYWSIFWEEPPVVKVPDSYFK